MTDNRPEGVELVQPRLVALLVKQLWERAAHEVKGHDEISAMNALLLADLAVETLLKFVVGAPKDAPKDARFPDLVKKAQEMYPGVLLPAILDAVNRVHRARNSVQHEAVPIARATSIAAVHDVKTALDRIFQVAFDIGFEDLSLMELISDPVLTLLLTNSRTALQARDERQAAVWLATAYEQVRLRWSDAFANIRASPDHARFLPMRGARLAPVVLVDATGNHWPGAIYFELDLADKSNVIASYSDPGFTLYETALLKRLEEYVVSFVAPNAHQPHGQTMSAPYGLSELDDLWQRVVRQVWRLEQSEPMHYGRDALVSRE